MVKSSIVIDIDDPRSDKIAEAISNKTSKKILSVLAEGEMAGSEIASRLGSPLNTITYNLKKLVDAGLVDKVNRVFWSSKGKRMEIFKLSNKQIIISPKRLVRGIIPAFVFAILISLLLLASFSAERGLVYSGENYAREISAPFGSDGASISATQESDIGLKSDEQSANQKIYNALYNAPNAWAWYLIGALSVLVFLILWNVKKNE